MNFQVSCDLDYQLHDPATFLFALKCIETAGQRILHESMIADPEVDVEDFTIGSGMNRFSRLKTLNPGNFKVSYRAEVSISHRIVPVSQLRADSPADLTPGAISYLFPSRYCPADLFRSQANELFGHLSDHHEIASAISDWVFENVSYVSGSSGESSSAIETMEQRQGVCRDFSHLAITLCRAMNLPARYATCYAYQLEPPDFHACFEVFIGGWWYIFDPTRLAPLNGLVRIATGRDAADAAVCTIFGNPDLVSSIVSCGCNDGDFIPVTRNSLVRNQQAIALL